MVDKVFTVAIQHNTFLKLRQCGFRHDDVVPAARRFSDTSLLRLSGQSFAVESEIFVLHLAVLGAGGWPS